VLCRSCQLAVRKIQRPDVAGNALRRHGGHLLPQVPHGLLLRAEALR
jgi:hypothetical protein